MEKYLEKTSLSITEITWCIWQYFCTTYLKIKKVSFRQFEIILLESCYDKINQKLIQNILIIWRGCRSIKKCRKFLILSKEVRTKKANIINRIEPVMVLPNLLPSSKIWWKFLIIYKAINNTSKRRKNFKIKRSMCKRRLIKESRNFKKNKRSNYLYSYNKWLRSV